MGLVCKNELTTVKCFTNVFSGGKVPVAVCCSEFLVVLCGSWRGFDSQKLLDKWLPDKSDVLSFVVADVGLTSAARRLM